MASSTSKCRGCLNKANSFCYVCGEIRTVARRRTITSLLRTAYFHYFDCKIGDQDKSWALHICCKPCYNGLTAWLNGRKAAFNFAIPMVWREPRNHADDCYFCLTNITVFNASSWKKIKYPNLRSAMRPVPHSDDLPVPTPPVNKDLLSSPDEEIPSREDSAESLSLEDIESTYSGTSGNKPHWITQEDLNDLARDLYLSKQQSELLAFRLKQWNLVQEDVRITSFRNQKKDLASFFDMENKLCYCTNITGLFTSLGLPHNPSDWRLFIDSSKRSLKSVLLHNGNKYTSTPIAHSVHLKESYDNMELLLEAIKYSEYQWILCGDLKVIGLLMGMQAGFTKYCCFLCLWDSRAVSQHYKQKDWGSRSTFLPGEHSLQENPLVDMNNVLLPPLHIKLGLMKNFVNFVAQKWCCLPTLVYWVPRS